MVLYRAMYGDFTHLKNWSCWRPVSGGIMVLMFFEVRYIFVCCVGACCVGKDEMLLFFCGDVATHRWWLTWIWKKLRTKGLVWFMRVAVFSLEIISTYVGSGINIRWGKNSLINKVSTVNLLKWLQTKLNVFTWNQLMVTTQYLFKSLLRTKNETYRITSMVTT